MGKKIDRWPIQVVKELAKYKTNHSWDKTYIKMSDLAKANHYPRLSMTSLRSGLGPLISQHPNLVPTEPNSPREGIKQEIEQLKELQKENIDNVRLAALKKANTLLDKAKESDHKAQVGYLKLILEALRDSDRAIGRGRGDVNINFIHVDQLQTLVLPVVLKYVKDPIDRVKCAEELEQIVPGSV